LPRRIRVTPGQLVKAVSIALDVPEEVVVQHDRNLVVAGLRTTGARGRNAPHVTPLDAARLLVAALGSVRTKESVETVRKFESAKFNPEKENWLEIIAASRARGIEITERAEKLLLRGPREFSDPAIDALPQTHNFIEGIAALISDASAPIEDSDRYLRRFAEIYIECGPGLFWAIIGRIWAGRVKYEWSCPKASTDEEEAEMFVPRYQRYATHYGIKQRRDVFGSAIMLLGKAFRDDGLPFETTKDALDALLGSKKALVESKKSA
jgi:hypothetical protein